MFAALDGRPPPGPPVDGRAHEHALEVMLDTIADGLHAFLDANLPKLAPHVGGAEGVQALIGWMAEYFLRMHHAFGDPAAVAPGWTAAVDRARPVAGWGPAVVATFQIGFPLLLPIVLERAGGGRPVVPILHEENAHALGLYRRHLRSGGHIDVTAVSGERLARELARGAVVPANVDTAYPGTRTTTRIPFLGRSLVTPTGLVAHALDRGVPVFAAALVIDGGRVLFEAEGPLSGERDEVAAAYGRFFESLVRRHPEQWMAWASLE